MYDREIQNVLCYHSYLYLFNSGRSGACHGFVHLRGHQLRDGLLGDGVRHDKFMLAYKIVTNKKENTVTMCYL
jgi:hypothetical protein